MLSKEGLLQAAATRREEVELSIGTVLMRELSVAQHSEWSEKLKGMEGDETAQAAAFVAVVLCNPDGSPMFGPADVEEGAAALQQLPMRDFNLLMKRFGVMHGADITAVEEAAGNSIATRTEPGSSGSLGTSDGPQPTRLAAS